MIVVDASLATKWSTPEPESDAALGLLAQYRHELVAPDLLLQEVTSAIVRRANMREVSAKDAVAAIRLWTQSWQEGLIAAHRTTTRHMRRASEMAIQLGHPLPDCVYLALAEDLGCELVTCDLRFRDRARADYPRVVALADFMTRRLPG